MSVQGWYLLPVKPAPGQCGECLAHHSAQEPHNGDSLYYAYHFAARHGRWPTWEDAIAHCDAAIQDIVRAVIAEHRERRR